MVANRSRRLDHLRLRKVRIDMERQHALAQADRSKKQGVPTLEEVTS